jgi:NADH-quinone oxidoreductase subunit J
MLIFLLCGLVVCSILAVFAKDLLKSAIALAGASIFLALAFFRMGAVYVGVFEVSVVAGLITVLFISTISLTRDEGEVKESRWTWLVFPAFFVGVVLLDLAVMGQMLGAVNILPGFSDTEAFGRVFWGERTFDLVAQIAIILAGVFCVLALFRKRSQDE